MFGIEVEEFGVKASTLADYPSRLNLLTDGLSPARHVPVDMAAFAIHINLFIQKPEVRVGFRPGQKNKRSKKGFMESDLIKSIGSSREQIECRGVPNEVRKLRAQILKYLCATQMIASLYILISKENSLENG